MAPVMPAPGETRRRSPTHDSHVLPVSNVADAAEYAEESPQKALLSAWTPTDKTQDFYTPERPHGKYTPLVAEQQSSFCAALCRKSRNCACITLGLLLASAVLYVAFPGTDSPLAALGTVSSEEHFVTVSGTHFELECRPFYVAGFNAHDLVPKSLADPSEHRTQGGRTGLDHIREMFENATRYNLNVVRIYAHTTDPEHPFQHGPGKYNAEAWEGLDRVLDEARMAGLKVIISLLDNWKYSGGVDEIVDWSKTVPKRMHQRRDDEAGDFDDKDLDDTVKRYEVERHALFFSDSDARRLYRENLKFITTRRNTANGRLYRDDPTIMAWGLLNEPRCETWQVPECPGHLQAWVEEMSGLMKKLDPNHLVTVGEEGFFGQGRDKAVHNPQEWGEKIGQDFVLDHTPSTVDFATVHTWPANWMREDEAYQREWLEAHMEEATSRLGKPLLLEEFGKSLRHLDPQGDAASHASAIKHHRDPVFEVTYAAVDAALTENRGLRGVLFWRWELPVYADTKPADYGVQPHDSTFAIIKRNAALTKRLTTLVAPAKSCAAGCWVAKGSTCVNDAAVCATRARDISKLGSDFHMAEGLSEVYASKASCCRPGLGAFLDGC